jgi:hypothetical protein
MGVTLNPDALCHVLEPPIGSLKTNTYARSLGINSEPHAGAHISSRALC